MAKSDKPRINVSENATVEVLYKTEELLRDKDGSLIKDNTGKPVFFHVKSMIGKLICVTEWFFIIDADWFENGAKTHSGYLHIPINNIIEIHEQSKKIV